VVSKTSNTKKEAKADTTAEREKNIDALMEEKKRIKDDKAKLKMNYEEEMQKIKDRKKQNAKELRKLKPKK
jgi:hypothetical protein